MQLWKYHGYFEIVKVPNFENIELILRLFRQLLLCPLYFIWIGLTNNHFFVKNIEI